MFGTYEERWSKTKMLRWVFLSKKELVDTTLSFTR